MADNTAEVKFIGNLEGIRVSITQLSELLRGLVNPIQGVRTQLGELAEAFAAAFAVEKISEFARGMGELGEQIERSAAIMGTSTDSVQQLAFIAKSSGTSIEALQIAFGRLSRSVVEQSDTTKRALAALGLSFGSLAGKDANATLDLLASRFKGIEDGATKDAIAMALLGRAGQQMIPFLNQGAEGMRKLREESAAIGAIIPPEAVAQLAEMHHQFVMMDAAVKGATVAAFMPFRGAVEGVVMIVTDLAAEFTAAMKSGGMMADIMTALGATVKALVTVLAAAIFVLKDLWAVGVFAADTVGDGFMTLGKVVKEVIAALARGWDDFFSGLIAVGSAAIDKLKAQFAGLANIGTAAVHFDLAGVKSAYSDMEKASADAGKKMADGLKQIGKGVDLSGAEREFSEHATRQRDRTSELGQTLLNNDRKFAKEYNTIWDTAHKHEEDSAKRAANFASPTNKDTVTAALKAIDEQIKAEQAALAQKVALYDLGASAFLMTQSERIAAVRSATEQEYNAELSLERSKLAIRGLTETQTQEIRNKIHALEDKHRLDEINLDKSAVAERQKTWQGYFDTIQGSFNGQLRGLLAGTTSFRQAFKTIIGDMVIAFIEGVEKMVFQWIAGQIGMTAAGASGAAARTAAEQAGTAGSIASTIALALSKISAGAAATVAGVTANQAPITGPAAVGEGIAAGAAVEVAAQSLLLAPFEIGAMRIPSVMPALLHPNEMVLPGPSADVVRDAMGGGGGGGDTHHWHISALDGASVMRVVPQIAKGLQSHYEKNRSARARF